MLSPILTPPGCPDVDIVLVAAPCLRFRSRSNAQIWIRVQAAMRDGRVHGAASSVPPTSHHTVEFSASLAHALPSQLLVGLLQYLPSSLFIRTSLRTFPILGPGVRFEAPFMRKNHSLTSASTFVLPPPAPLPSPLPARALEPAPSHHHQYHVHHERQRRPVRRYRSPSRLPFVQRFPIHARLFLLNAFLRRPTTRSQPRVRVFDIVSYRRTVSYNRRQAADSLYVRARGSDAREGVGGAPTGEGDEACVTREREDV
ncbi:hypothetical protein C8R45DRAFT_1183741 [Mycena sanguinolenta]|nr:hypothetical protein C8R45DRAFT_1183741 [Mycena sanguinolenta]